MNQATGLVGQRVASPARLEHTVMLTTLEGAAIVHLGTAPVRKEASVSQTVTDVSKILNIFKPTAVSINSINNGSAAYLATHILGILYVTTLSLPYGI